MRELLRFGISLFIISCFIQPCIAQNSDTIPEHDEHTHRDTFYMIHENVPKSKFWGNSWYLSPAYNLSRTNEFNFSFGRTYGSRSCGGAGCVTTTRSWGLAYSFSAKSKQNSNTTGVFWESCFFYFPPFSAGIRGEYFYDITNQSHYLRPSAGLSLVFVDIFYNYSFNLSGSNNEFSHGVIFRLKYFIGRKNWQENYPNRC